MQSFGTNVVRTSIKWTDFSLAILVSAGLHSETMERRTRLITPFPKPMRDEHLIEERLLCAGLPQTLLNAKKLRSHIENALPAIVQCVKALEPETYHQWLDTIVARFIPRAKQVSGTCKHFTQTGFDFWYLSLGERQANPAYESRSVSAA